MLKKEKQPLENLKIVFCSDDYLLKLNRQFLKHDTYTDILSFPFSEKGEPLVAEIYVSVDRVLENARTGGFSFQNELLRVIFHGILHLCGYKDKAVSDIRLMRKMEDKYLNEFLRVKKQALNNKTTEA
jgi:probable rRNA maturation factor